MRKEFFESFLENASWLAAFIFLLVVEVAVFIFINSRFGLVPAILVGILILVCAVS